MSADYAAQRTNMVESQVRTQDVTDLAIQDAMRTVAREHVLPAAKAVLAYADAEIEYAPGRWLLRPRYVAKLLQSVAPRAGERALAIAAPYAALVLEAMGLTVERLDDSALKAPKGAWDVIVCEGAVAHAPENWTTALAQGGRLGVVERQGPAGQAMIYLKSGHGLGARSAFDCAAPYLTGFEPAPAFAF